MDQIEELKKELAELKVSLDKIAAYLVDDANSNSKGIVSRVNEIEHKLENINTFVKNAKWVIAAIGLPVLVQLIKAFISGFNALKAYAIIS